MEEFGKAGCENLGDVPMRSVDRFGSFDAQFQNTLQTVLWPEVTFRIDVSCCYQIRAQRLVLRDSPHPVLLALGNDSIAHVTLTNIVFHHW